MDTSAILGQHSPPPPHPLFPSLCQYFQKAEFQNWGLFKTLISDPHQAVLFQDTHCHMDEWNGWTLTPPHPLYANPGCSINHLITCTQVFPSGCGWWSCCSWCTCSGRSLCETWAPRLRTMLVHCWVATEVCLFYPQQSFSLCCPVPGTLSYEHICGRKNNRHQNENFFLMHEQRN